MCLCFFPFFFDVLQFVFFVLMWVFLCFFFLRQKESNQNGLLQSKANGTKKNDLFIYYSPRKAARPKIAEDHQKKTTAKVLDFQLENTIG